MEELNSTRLIEMAQNDFDMLKEKGKEGEWALHYHGYLDGFADGRLRGIKEMQANIEAFREELKKKYSKFYDYYLRKASCESEYSRNVAPWQLETLRDFRDAVFEVMKEKKILF